MDFPEIEGYTLKAVIGTGSCGTVYVAERDQGGLCVVKILASLAINRDVLGYSFGKVGSALRPPVILDVFEYDMVGSPLFISMPFIGEFDEEGQPVPHSLESVCGRITEAEAWVILSKVASGIAFLHREGVVHCNLKPSNVLFAVEGEQIEPRITDISLGWLGGIHRMELDALLPYLAPEQIRAPDEIFEGAGLRWDVYGFGVLAYQLITGRLPRIADYVEVARRRQDPQGVGLPFVVDDEDFSQRLRDEEVIRWPEKTVSRGDARRRAVVERCLCLNPKERWVDLRDIEREFVAIDQALKTVRIESKAKHEKSRQRDKLVRTRALLAGAISAVTAAGLFGFWKAGELATARQDRVQLQDQLNEQIAGREGKLELLQGELSEARDEREKALESFRQSQGQIDELLAAILGSSREIGEVLEGSQLSEAREFYEERVGSNSSKVVSEARIRDLFNLGLLRQGVGDLDGALRAFHQVQQQVVDYCSKPIATEARMDALTRAARAAFKEHGMLDESGENTEALKALRRSRGFYAELREEGVSDPGVLESAAAVSLRLGRRLRTIGLYKEAAETQIEASRILEGVMDDPTGDSGRSGLMARQSTHELGLVRRLEGQLSAAVALQLEVVEGILPNVETGLASFEDKRLLAFAYTELAEMVAGMAGPQDGLGAHRQAVTLLKDLLAERPGDVLARYAMARNFDELAAYDRDVGSRDESLKKRQIGVGILEQLLAEELEDSGLLRVLRVEYAEQKTSLAELLGDGERSEDAVAAGEAALTALETLLEEPSVAEDERVDEVRRRAGLAMARVLGVLGHNHEKLGDTASARKFFARAIDGWKALVETGEGVAVTLSEEIDRGLAWSEDRLAKLR